MKILVITYLYPYPPNGGYKLRVYNTVRELCKNNEIDLLSFTSEEIDLEFQRAMQIYCKNVYVKEKPVLSFTKKIFRYMGNLFSFIPYILFSAWDIEKINALNDIVNNNKYDVIIAEHLIAAHIVYNSDCDAKPLYKVIVNHNVESYLYKSVHLNKYSYLKPYFYVKHRIMQKYEQKVNKIFDLSVVMSENDSAMFVDLCPDNEFVALPNGVDTEYFSLRSDLPRNHDIYFVGNLSYFPNIDAVRYFMEKIFPLVKKNVEDIRVFILGSNPPRDVSQYHDGRNVIVTGYQEDIRLITQQCRATIVPLRLGSGTRLKIVEAMSMGIPVISSSKGAEGLEVGHDRDIVIADDIDFFANRLVRLLVDDEYVQGLVKNARALVESRYSWRKITNDLLSHINNKSRRLTDEKI